MSMLRSLALAAVITLVGILLVGIQQYRIQTVRAEAAANAAEAEAQRKAKQDAIDANLVSQATISTLQQELEKNRQYAADLAERIKVSEGKAEKARKDYENLKKNSKPVRDWAAQPLPDGLRGKTAKPSGGNKDNRNSPRGT